MPTPSFSQLASRATTLDQQLSLLLARSARARLPQYRDLTPAQTIHSTHSSEHSA
jgi:hypothetical protein